MKKQTLFGTDGIRGASNSLLFNEENMFKLAQILGKIAIQSKYKTVFIGQDTRESGESIKNALCLGLNSVGIDASLLGVTPTPVIAYLTKKFNAYFGIEISASHNPACDNGIKIFDIQGHKISNYMQNIIEHCFFNESYKAEKNNSKIAENKELIKAYKKHVFDCFNFINKNIKIVLDCANGAAYELAPEILREFGFELTVINANPNGNNINLNCGSEYTKTLQKIVKESKADLGIAFDGDADRAIFIDENGEKIDGEAIIALLAIHLKTQNKLRNNLIATTIMSSNALDKALIAYDIKVLRSDVGDKNVASLMNDKNISFGGENSGHFIYKPFCTTGDGIMSALKIISLLLDKKQSMSKMCSFFIPSQQMLFNINVTKKIPLTNLPKTNSLINLVQDNLKDHGRILFRYSGTEMKARLLVESSAKEECEEIAQKIIMQFNEEISSC
jgi:phosphoglucosamine mutase